MLILSEVIAGDGQLLLPVPVPEVPEDATAEGICLRLKLSSRASYAFILFINVCWMEFLMNHEV